MILLAVLIANLTVPIQLPDIIGFGIPLLVDLITHASAPPWAKTVANLALSALGGVLSSILAGHVAWQSVIFNGALTFLISVGSYFGWYKPTGVAAKVQARVGGFGFGRGWVGRHRQRPCVPARAEDQLRSVDHSAMKLGRLPRRDDPRTFRLERYLTAALPCPPATVDWSAKVGQWPMMGNDAVGDCTVAAAGHLIEEWTTYAAAAFVPSDDQVLAAYSAITGYDPAQVQPDGSNPTDQGANELAVLNYWRQTGIAGRKITAYAAVDPRATLTVRQAVDLFGGLYIGVALPLSAKRQAVWDVPTGGAQGDGAPGSWGGHAVPVVGYTTNPDGSLATLTCVTWGSLKTMTGAFWAAYCEEAYAVVSADFLAASGLDPQGLNLAQLLADLAAIPQPAAAV